MCDAPARNIPDTYQTNFQEQLFLMLRKQQQLAPYEVQPRPHEILHVKCYIIKLIKDQMLQIGKNRCECSKGLQHNKAQAIEGTGGAKAGSGGMGGMGGTGGTGGMGGRGSWMGCLRCLIYFLLLCALFTYGALVGANICQSKKCGCFSVFPAISMTQTTHPAVY